MWRISVSVFLPAMIGVACGGISQAKYDALKSQLRDARLEALGEKVAACGTSAPRSGNGGALQAELAQVRRELAAKTAEVERLRAGRGGSAGGGGGGKPTAEVRPRPSAEGDGGGGGGGGDEAWEPKVAEGLSVDQVRDKVVKKYGYRIKRCYKKAKRRRKALAGQVEITFRIDKRGKVRRVKIGRDTIKYRTLSRCLRSAVGRMRFPRPKPRGNVEVSWPFKFPLG